MAETATPATNGVPEWRKLMTERQVARSCGVRSVSVRSIVFGRPELAPYHAPDETNRYTVEQAEKIAELVALAKKARGEREAEEEEDEDDEPEPPKGRKHGTAAVIKELTLALKQAHEHNEKLIALVVAPQQLLLTSVGAHQERLAARIAELEKQSEADRKLRDEQLSARHEQALAEELVRSSMRRKEALFEAVQKKIPSVLDAVELSLAGGKGLAAKGKTAAELLASLTPLQVQALLDPSMTILSEEQRAKVALLLGITETETKTPEPKKEEP